MVVFDPGQEVSSLEKGERSQAQQNVRDQGGLLSSLQEHNQQRIDQGVLVEESFNQNVGTFVASMMFDQIVKNYQLAKQLYGDTILRLLTGFDPQYIEKNINIPEFRKLLQQKLEQAIEQLRKDQILNKDGTVTEKGVELSSVVLCMRELEHTMPRGFMGEKHAYKRHTYGERAGIMPFKKGARYRDIAIRKTLARIVKRGHSEIHKEDLQLSERKSKGAVSIIYAIDTSASMRGDKISTCRKAGVALAYKAITEKDKVGLVVFGSEVKDSVAPTTDFGEILNHIAKIQSGKQTNFNEMMQRCIELLRGETGTRHIMILSDALPTVGKEPEKETLQAISAARAEGITISLIGIKLDDRGKELAKRMAQIGEGRFLLAKRLEDVDTLVLEEYATVTQ